MASPKLFHLPLPQNTEFELRQKISSLDSDAKASLTFLQNQSLILANKSLCYRKVLQSMDLSAIDGNILHWAMWKSMKASFLPRKFSEQVTTLPLFLRFLIFLPSFIVQFVLNYITLILGLLLKYNYTKHTKTQNISGHKFSFDLLKLANKKKWKTLILSENTEADMVTKDLTTRLYPDLDLIWWDHKVKNLAIMLENKAETSQISSKEDEKFLKKRKSKVNLDNLFDLYPELYAAQEFIIQQSPDLIITTLPNYHGEQEFFMHLLKINKDLNFRLIAGVEDHNLFNFKKNVITYFKNILMKLKNYILLLFWATQNEFVSLIKKPSFKIINVVKNINSDYLLVQNSDSLEYSFPTISVKNFKKPEEEGVDYISKEFNIKTSNINIEAFSKQIDNLEESVTFLNFIRDRLDKNSIIERRVNIMHYNASGIVKDDVSIKWVAAKELQKALPVNQRCVVSMLTN